MDNQSGFAARYGVCDRLGEYRLLPIFRNITEALGAQIIELWQRNHALPAGMNPMERVPQVVIAAVDAGDKVVAVSTVYRAPFSHSGLAAGPADTFYFFRTFVQPGDRVHHLSRKITAATYDHLKKFEEADKPRGIMIVAENPKLTKAVLERLVGSLGWRHIGADARGKLVYRRDF